MSNTFPLGYLANFLSTDYYNLEGFLKNANSTKNNTEVAILHIHGLHSGWASSTGLSLFTLAENIFLINTRGTGIASSLQRSINGKKEYLTAGSAFEVFEDCTKDICGAVNFLKAQGYKKIILSGHSTGCQKIIFTQLEKNLPEIIGLILLAPADDLSLNKQLFSHLFADKLKKSKNISYLSPQVKDFNLLSGRRFWEQNNPDSKEGNIFNYAQALTYLDKVKIPILSIFGKQEQYAVIPPHLMLEKIQIHMQNTHSQSSLISGDHSFTGSRAELIQTIQDWILKIKKLQ